ncbi:hypothetical protein ABNG02_16075 [Halorubrum ejinorense]|uniref:Uncharacterized protein n=1 Tax=Halorubrum ejinorense TaxID=425309 RepID=A0AAV3SVB2_9EURY
MSPPDQASAIQKRPLSATGSGTPVDARDRFTGPRFLTRGFVNRAAYVRLHAELSTARPEFELLAERTRSEDDSWVAYGRELLAMAEADLRSGALDEAWRHLHTAKRLEVYGLEKLEGIDSNHDRGSELRTRAAVIRGEALDALGGWPRQAVVDLLCDETEALKDEITGAELRAASRILDDQYESVYLNRSERQRQFNQLVLMGALSGLTLLALTLLDWVWNGTSGLTGSVASLLETPWGEPATATPGFAVFMIIAGVMGASLFGMRSLRNRSLSTKIPQQINQLTVTGARGVIGAISALLFYFVLQTPLLQNGTIIADDVITAPIMVVIGFAAGYAERMAPNVVATVASVTEPSETAEQNSNQ